MKKVYYNWENIEDMISDIVQQIAVDGDKFKPDYVVGLTRGGLIPATMSSSFSLTYQPSIKPMINPIVKNIIFYLLFLLFLLSS